MTRVTSPGVSTSSIRHDTRFARADRFRRRWRLSPLVRNNLPEPVSLKRFEVDLWVLILGTITSTRTIP